MRRKNFKVGLDLGSKLIRVVVTTEDEENPLQRRVITGAVEPSEGIRHGRILSKEDAEHAIKNIIFKVEKELEEKIDSLFLGITGDYTKIKIFKSKNTVSKASNEVSELDFEKAKSEALQSIPIDSPYTVLNISLSEIKLDGKKVRGNPINQIGGILETRYILHLIPKKILEEYINLFDDLDIKIKEIVSAPTVFYIPVTKRRERIAGIGVLNIGHDNTSFIYFENELPVINKTWAIGGSNITNDIALILQTKIEDAEEIKKNFKNLNIKKVAGIINARVEDICDLILKEVNTVNELGKITGGIILIGGGSKIEDIETTMKKRLNMQVTLGSKLIQEVTKNVLKDSSWATAYGLTFLEDKDETFWEHLLSKLKTWSKKLLNTISP
jgi:cell division protein FtsA